jgi:hypothetical protein
MNALTDRQIVNARGERSAGKAATAARWQSVVRGWRTATVVLLAGLCLLACTAVLQVLFVGVADTLGVAPQFSFLSLNLGLIALFSWFAPPKYLFRLKRERRRKSASAEAKAARVNAFGLNIDSPPGQVCKVLVIRRLAQGVHSEPRESWQALGERSRRREVTLDA